MLIMLLKDYALKVALYTASMNLFKFNNRNTRTICEIDGVIDIILVSLLLTLNRFHTF